MADDYSYESVFAYLRSGLSDVSEEEVDLLEDYIIAMGIRGSKRYNEPFTRSFGRKNTIDLKTLNIIREKLLKEIGPLYEILKDKDMTVAGFTQGLYELGIRLRVWDKLEELNKYFKDENQPLMSKEYEQVYRIVMELYDQIVLLLGDEIIGLKEYTGSRNWSCGS